jgi:hypothetical protein
MTIWRLKIWKGTLIWGPPYDGTIDINNVNLFHYMIQQIDVFNVLFQIR